MPKKVKSFAMEEEPYEELFKIFKDSFAEVNLSYCMNKFVKDFLRYLKPIDQALKESSGYTVPMAFIIETKAREPLFRFLDEDASPGAGESSLVQELRELQGKYNEHIKKNPRAARDEGQEFGKHIPIVAFAKFLGRIMVEDTMNLGKTPDDRYREVAMEAGGKELIHFIREKVWPALERVSPEAKPHKKKAKKEE